MKSPGSVCDGRRLEGGHPLIYPAIYFVFCNEIREPLIMTAGMLGICLCIKHRRLDFWALTVKLQPVV